MSVINNSFELREEDTDCRIFPRNSIEKGWGWLNGNIGEVFAFHTLRADGNKQNDLDQVETVKLLYIAKDKRLSTHYHLKKTEIFVCVTGAIKVVFVDGGEERSYDLKPGDHMRVRPGKIHYMVGLEENSVLLEVSTEDFANDSYRIEEGDKVGRPYKKKNFISDEEKEKFELVKDLELEDIKKKVAKIK